jgi:hypothetical protein
MFGMMSVFVRSMPVSMSPTRTPLPRLTEYDARRVAPIAPMSHWQALSGFGPTLVGTL